MKNLRYFDHFKIFITFIVVLTVSIIFSQLFYDASWDGQTYHQQAILKIYEGFNPYYDTVSSNELHSVWVNHYPKATWIIAATLLKFTENIESSKFLNIYFIITSLIVSYSTFSSFNNLQTQKKVLLSACLALNPVTMCQSFTFYLDGLLYSLLLIIGCLLFLSKKDENYSLLIISSLVSIILINIKFTGLVYYMIFWASSITYIILRKRFQHARIYLFGSFVCLFFSIAIFCFNPYVSNFISKGHPFHPLMGASSDNIMRGNKPDNLFDKNRFVSYAYGLFGKSDNSLDSVELKVPFSITKPEIISYANSDTRIGGWGPLFGGIVIISLLSLMYAILISQPKFFDLHILILALTILTFSIFINPEAWWARYSPQSWAIPIIISVYLFLIKSKVSSILAYTIIYLSILNSSIVGGANFVSNIIRTSQIHQQINYLRTNTTNVIAIDHGPFISLKRRLLEKNISFPNQKIVLDKDLPTNKIYFYSTWNQAYFTEINGNNFAH